MDDEVREKLRVAGRIAREAKELGVSLCRDGTSLLDIAERIEAHMRSRGAPPAFPTCISLDHVAAHYSPLHDDRLALRRGNVVKLDLGAQVDGYIADTAVTVEVGTRNWTDLIKASEVALETAIEVCRPKTPPRLLGAAIERAIESYGYKPISNLTGHTIERYKLHAGKSIPNVGGASSHGGGDVIEAGDTGAIKPAATRDFLKRIEESFHTLPFAERWCYAFDPKASVHLSRLLRAGLVMTYEALLDVGGGMVSQTEHTMIVDDDGVEVTTR